MGSGIIVLKYYPASLESLPENARALKSQPRHHVYSLQDRYFGKQTVADKSPLKLMPSL